MDEACGRETCIQKFGRWAETSNCLPGGKPDSVRRRKSTNRGLPSTFEFTSTRGQTLASGTRKSGRETRRENGRIIEADRIATNAKSAKDAMKKTNRRTSGQHPRKSSKLNSWQNGKPKRRATRCFVATKSLRQHPARRRRTFPASKSRRVQTTNLHHRRDLHHRNPSRPSLHFPWILAPREDARARPLRLPWRVSEPRAIYRRRNDIFTGH